MPWHYWLTIVAVYAAMNRLRGSGLWGTGTNRIVSAAVCALVTLAYAYATTGEFAPYFLLAALAWWAFSLPAWGSVMDIGFMPDSQKDNWLAEASRSRTLDPHIRDFALMTIRGLYAAPFAVAAVWYFAGTVVGGLALAFAFAASWALCYAIAFAFIFVWREGRGDPLKIAEPLGGANWGFFVAMLPLL